VTAAAFVVEVPPEIREALAQEVRQSLLADQAFLAELANAANASPWLHGLEALAAYTGIPLNTLKKLNQRDEIPCAPRDGPRSPVICHKPTIDAWILDGGYAKMPSNQKAGGA
jgi:hypothetical protein